MARDLARRAVARREAADRRQLALAAEHAGPGAAHSEDRVEPIDGRYPPARGGVDHEGPHAVPRRQEAVRLDELAGRRLVGGAVVDMDVFGDFSRPFPLGTDYLGRDMLSRILYGARYTVGVALAAALLASGIGTLSGLLAAVCGRLAGRGAEPARWTR